MARLRRWTPSEISYMKNHWGEMSIPAIAKKLKRSINAIKIKARKVGLKDQRLYMQEISLNQLQNIIFKKGGGQMNYKIESYDVPFTYKRIVNKKIKVVHMDRFWDWLDKNRHAISLHDTDRESFGYEPAWVDEKRQADKRAYIYEERRPWTEDEDNRLRQLLKSYKYGYRDISIRLKRTEGALKRRMTDLKIKERPLRADNHNPWKSEEIEVVKKLYLKGYKSCIIAEYVDRSALAINGLLERHNYFK